MKKIYSCAICLGIKNSEFDGLPYKIRISTNPNKISDVCPFCRPNVVALSE